MRFIRPVAALEASHESFVAEFRRREEPIVPWIVEEPYAHFADYLRMLDDASRGIGIPAGFVPHSTFWLVDERGEIVAVSNLRHALTEHLLRYGGNIGFGVRPSARRLGHATEVLRRTLLEAKSLGLQRVRMTCSKGNTASARTIERNGGVLDDEEFFPEHAEVVSRYWIDL